MLQPQTERVVITVGIVLSLAGVWTLINGLWEWHCSDRFHANARQATATVVSTTNAPRALRFKTDDGTIDVPVARRGFNSPVGSSLQIWYEPKNPQGWRTSEGYDPLMCLGLASGGGVMLLTGAGLLTLGWVSRRRKDRPFWK
jgi:hypothetical protein